MRLVCLECSAAYEAPDSLFGQQPREVRCNRCGYQWTVVGSPPETNAAPAGLSIAPAPEVQLPRPAMAAAKRADSIAAPSPPPPPPAAHRSASLAETLAGELTPSENLAANDGPRLGLVAEPAARSTRTLLSSVSRDESVSVPPDPEERRLSHELDFGESERPPLARAGGATRRVVVILILLILSAGIAAVVFETQIIAAVPALQATYAKLGL